MGDPPEPTSLWLLPDTALQTLRGHRPPAHSLGRPTVKLRGWQDDNGGKAALVRFCFKKIPNLIAQHMFNCPKKGN